MSDDDLLRALGQDLRRRDEALDADDAPASLRRPLDEDEAASVLDRAFARLAAEAEVDEATPREGTDVVASDEHAEGGTEGSGGVLSLEEARASRRSAVAIAGVLLAVAAAVLLWWVVPRSGDTPDTIASLPPYAVTRLAAGEASDRADPQAVPDHIELRPDGRIEAWLTPASPVREPVGLVIVARPSAGEPRLVRVEQGLQVSDSGGVRLEGSLRRFVSLTPGEWTLVLVVGPVASLPVSLEQWRAASEPPPWRAIEVRATILAD